MSLIEKSVCDKILKRAKFGHTKYGKTLERLDLTLYDWLMHAQEEAMDLANYLEVIMQKVGMLVAIDKLQHDLGEWSDATFGSKRSCVGPLKHLKQEIDEVVENPKDIEEWADCFLLFLDAARLQGIDIDKLLFFSELKLEKNKLRGSGDINDEHIINH